MYPVNQVILGNDSIFNPSGDIDTQIKMMEAYRDRLQQIKSNQTYNKPQRLIWDDIDELISPMSNSQKAKMMEDEDYVNSYNKIQSLVQSELLNLVKAKIENSPEGKELLESQLKIVRKLKDKIIEDTDKEMELFNKFKEYSKIHNEVTYDEFLKNNQK